MKRLLTISLFLNLALFCLLVRPLPAPHAETTGKTLAGTNRYLFQRTRAMRRALPQPAAQTPWQALEAREYRLAIERLRALGCPGETVRDIVVMRLAHEYRDRLEAIQRDCWQMPQWWRDTNDAASWDAFWRAKRNLPVEMRLQAEELLGVPYQEILKSFGVGQANKGDEWLSPERQRQLTRMENRFKDEIGDLRGMEDGMVAFLTPEQKARLAELKQRQRAELAQFFSPAELEAYDLRHSDAANYALRELPPAKDEAEFRLMVKAAQEGNIKPVFLDGYDLRKEIWSSGAVAEKEKQQIMDRLKTALGEEAYVAMMQRQERAVVQQRAEEEAQSQSQMIEDLTKAARAAGVDTSLVTQFDDRMKKALETLPHPPEGTDLTAEQRKENEAKVNAIAERIAGETFGDRGGEFVNQMKKRGLIGP